eukprot:4963351-Prymnesium_polylepis.1
MRLIIVFMDPDIIWCARRSFGITCDLSSALAGRPRWMSVSLVGLASVHRSAVEHILMLHERHTRVGW